jgi:hypothetical protein
LYRRAVGEAPRIAVNIANILGAIAEGVENEAFRWAISN